MPLWDLEAILPQVEALKSNWKDAWGKTQDTLEGLSADLGLLWEELDKVAGETKSWLLCLGVTMTAGVVSAPFIIANSSLHTHGSRRDIDTDTPVFIQSDTPGVLIFYTLDGSKPDMVQCGSAARVRKYSKPIRLPAGRVTVRAIAVTSDGRESSIVTKMFMVQNRDSNKKGKDVLLTNEQNLCEEPPYSAGFSELWMRGDVSFKSLTAAAQNGSQFKNSDPLMQASRTKMSGLSQESKYLQDKEVITNLLRSGLPGLILPGPHQRHWWWWWLYDGGAEDVTIIVTDWEQLDVLGEGRGGEERRGEERRERRGEETRPDQTRPDQTRPDQTRPDQTRGLSGDPGSLGL
ncbi:hypothetical protein D4764_06G0007110 [Takifugu flavidus]|uniref:Uncharacterized protein n=1 Tax=Takifugu flavidus TaxID=433684 RepID=A0A5C6MYN0_9TELE|nr:hypothetical protein D4764_06G0007110 [Takifugu flavidus]